MALEAARAEGALLKRIEPHLDATDDLKVYCSLLFAGETDGLEQYRAEALAELAQSSFAFASTKPHGRHSIRWQSVELAAASGRRPVTVVEIINDDMPFLVDSIVNELQARGLSAELVLHPILKVQRSSRGEFEAILGPGDRNWADGTQESWITLLLDRMTSEAADDLISSLSEVLKDVRIAVTDWHSMTARFERAAQALEASPPPIAPGLVSETLAFCRWLLDGQFTFLGLREYRLVGNDETGDLVPIPETGLGVLRNPKLHVLSGRGEPLEMTPDMRSHFFAPHPLVISKSSIMSRVHRRVFMDYVGLKTYKEDGSLAGELRLVGLFTSQAYTQPPQQIPFLRHKVETVMARSEFAPGSHAAKALANVLATFPRDELFQIDEQLLLNWSREIVNLDLRPRVKVFARFERFERFVSVLVYIPRDRFSTTVRERIGDILAEVYGGHVRDFTPFFPEGPLVRVHYIIERHEETRLRIREQDLEAQITEATRTWDDRLTDALTKAGGNFAALAPKYLGAFPAGYTETFSAKRAIEDIARIERLSPEQPLAIDFHADEGEARRLHAAIYRFDQPIPLSERVPVLENMGFFVIDERSYRVTPRIDGATREVALHDMVLEPADGIPIDLPLHDRRAEECFLAVCRGDAENDNFNRLVITAGADWREVAALRAYATYLRQIGVPFGFRYIGETLNRHAGVARDFLELFHTRFDPDRRWTREQRAEAEQRIRKRIQGALGQVASLDEDRILRHYLSLISATVRTNFFQRDEKGRPPATIAFKLAPELIDGLPEPKPYREIWVYSPRVEGVHLRFAPIARGGIRWSDRAQDFRTEVLGLAKAQQVKNTVIVPQGAKGGFVPKQLPRSGSRGEIAKEGLAAYRAFISSMLDITDNIVGGEIVPPDRVVRHDGDDPYLVVAADKGTATFSDPANEISLQHNYWLGDAFASGGSAGYDHKRMGITARGAWECVKRHFREMDIDIEAQPFRVVGVGDMSGDVFGNGMLRSRTIKLIAAFDHRDIFIDPDPDPEASFAERKRLFELPRSSWQDYNKALISRGGGVFSRSAKSIPLSPEMRSMLGVDAETMTPAELIRAILTCETDLLWFGGIGTFIRASHETNEQVGDRANDAIRVTAQEVRAKVIGEGANLAVTQLGRIEFARNGGRINTDFIDNSAGVNSSDLEVNIKIALGPAVASGRLDPQARRELLASMTEDVAAACLVNNYQQSLALSLAERRALRDAVYLSRLMEDLEERGLLDRKLQFLPSPQEMAQRQSTGIGMTRPELAVLLSLAKLALSKDLISTSLPDDPVCEPLLTNYFPEALRENFFEEIKAHRLRREIIVTGLTNAMLNRGGPAMAVRLADESGRGPGDVAAAFLIVSSVFHLPHLWHAVDALDGKMPGQAQLDLYLRIQDFLLEQVSGLLRTVPLGDLAATIANYRAGVEELSHVFGECLTPAQLERVAASRQAMERSGATPEVAERIAALDVLSHAMTITRLARETNRPIMDAARIAFAASDYFHLDELKTLAAGLQIRDYFDRLAVNGAIYTLETARRALSREVLHEAIGAADFAAWEREHGGRLARAKMALDEIAATGDLTVSRLTVVASRVRDLTSV